MRRIREKVQMKMIQADCFVRSGMQKLKEDESGMGVVEIALIIVVLIGLVVIFKGELGKLMDGIFSKYNIEGI